MAAEWEALGPVAVGVVVWARWVTHELAGFRVHLRVASRRRSLTLSLDVGPRPHELRPAAGEESRG